MALKPALPINLSFIKLIIRNDPAKTFKVDIADTSESRIEIKGRKNRPHMTPDKTPISPNPIFVQIHSDAFINSLTPQFSGAVSAEREREPKPSNGLGVRL